MKWLVALVLIAAANAKFLREADDLVCTPGSTFKIKCNTCFCMSSGMDYGCTRMACPGWEDYDMPEYQGNEVLYGDNRDGEAKYVPEYQGNEVLYGDNKDGEAKYVPEYQGNALLYGDNRDGEAKYENSRKKRAADDVYSEDEQFFVDEEPAPRSIEQQKQLARQDYLQQQQDYYDQVRLQEDLARENAELEQQQDEMRGQLEFQQEQDEQQWQEDARQLALERQQLFLEQQRQLLEQQQQQKLDEQYYKKARNYARKNAMKPVPPQ